MKFHRTHAAALVAVVACAVALALFRAYRGREGIRFEPAELGASTWVRIYDPPNASGGYTLVLYQRRIPMLIDMNGNIVHAWPEVRGRGRARLTKDGTLLVICTDEVIRELDWDGNLLWEFENDAGEDFPHHDLRRLRNGNTLLIYRDMVKGTDYFLEVDDAGEVVWEWRSGVHLEPFLSDQNLNDRTHINSVQELPPNRWHEAGDPRFEPGNLLISARQLNTVLILDKETGEPVWRYDRELDYQHEALMIEHGHPGAGNILLFNNGFHNRRRYRSSSVIEIDPSDHSLLWEYSDDSFFSRTGGVEQSLPNGNVLIVSSRGGRVFEVDRSGNVVWQWVPPFRPMRPQRYAYDYSSRFADLGRSSEQPVDPGAPPHIDYDLHLFALEGDSEPMKIGGETRNILKQGGRPTPRICRRVVMPDDPVLRIGYGLDRKALSARGSSQHRAIFGIEIRSGNGGDGVSLMKEVADVDDRQRWYEKTIDLGEYARSTVELCLDAEVELIRIDDEVAEVALMAGATLWEVPQIMPFSAIPAALKTEIETAREKTAEAERQLEALGYVD